MHRGIETLLILPGMLVFWTLQTACFGLYSQTGNTAAAHAVIAMICTSTLCLFFYVEIDLLCATEVLFYGFCEYISLSFFFLLSRNLDKSFVDDVRIYENNDCNFIHIHTFRSHEHLWSYREFYYGNSE